MRPKIKTQLFAALLASKIRESQTPTFDLKQANHDWLDGDLPFLSGLVHLFTRRIESLVKSLRGSTAWLI